MGALLSWVLDGCAHVKMSFPITRGGKDKNQGSPRKTYVVCLDCGKEIPYSWEEMRLMRAEWVLPRFTSLDLRGRDHGQETLT